MFDHLLESSQRDDSNKWSNIGFGQEITELASIEVNFTHLIWCSGAIDEESIDGEEKHKSNCNVLIVKSMLITHAKFLFAETSVRRLRWATRLAPRVGGGR